MTCLNETRESYAEEIVVQLQSEGKDDGEVEENVRRIAQWAENWRRDQQEEESQRHVWDIKRLMDVWIVDGIECLLVLLVECIMCIDS